MLLVLGLLVAVSTGMRQQLSRQRRAEFQAHLERQADERRQDVRTRIDAGEIWIGQLHGAIDDLPEAPGPPRADAPSSLPFQKRIMHRIDMHGFTLLVELHECHPGSPLCSTGGSIEVHRGERSVCLVSVGLLQALNIDGKASHYRIDWQPTADHDPFTVDEKLQIVQQLACDRRPATPVEFRDMLRTAYGDEMQSDAGKGREHHLRSLVSTVFSAIVVSRAQ